MEREREKNSGALFSNNGGEGMGKKGSFEIYVAMCQNLITGFKSWSFRSRPIEFFPS